MLLPPEQELGVEEEEDESMKLRLYSFKNFRSSLPWWPRLKRPGR